jgi:hypothetical protein
MTPGDKQGPQTIMLINQIDSIVWRSVALSLIFH